MLNAGPSTGQQHRTSAASGSPLARSPDTLALVLQFTREGQHFPSGASPTRPPIPAIQSGHRLETFLYTPQVSRVGTLCCRADTCESLDSWVIARKGIWQPRLLLCCYASNKAFCKQWPQKAWGQGWVFGNPFCYCNYRAGPQSFLRMDFHELLRSDCAEGIVTEQGHFSHRPTSCAGGKVPAALSHAHALV